VIRITELNPGRQGRKAAYRQLKEEPASQKLHTEKKIEGLCIASVPLGTYMWLITKYEMRNPKKNVHLLPIRISEARSAEGLRGVECMQRGCTDCENLCRKKSPRRTSPVCTQWLLCASSTGRFSREGLNKRLVF
jgi:hypothetical protein